MFPAIALSPEDEDIGARTLCGEADDQGEAGKIAVAWVIRNRMLWIPAAWWGLTVARVCQYPWQFSCWVVPTAKTPNANHDRISAMSTDDPAYQQSLKVLRGVMAGEIPDPTGGATTYKVRGTKAQWDLAVEGFSPCGIGAHDFWRLSPTGPCLAFLEPETQVA